MYAMEIKITAADGSVVFQQAGEAISDELMKNMVAGCEKQTASQGLTVTNPKYDETQETNETNQPMIAAIGPIAVGALVKWFLGEMAMSVAGVAEADAVKTRERDLMRESIATIKIVDRQRKAEPEPITPPRTR